MIYAVAFIILTVALHNQQQISGNEREKDLRPNEPPANQTENKVVVPYWVPLMSQLTVLRKRFLIPVASMKKVPACIHISCSSSSLQSIDRQLFVLSFQAPPIARFRLPRDYKNADLSSLRFGCHGYVIYNANQFWLLLLAAGRKISHYNFHNKKDLTNEASACCCV